MSLFPVRNARLAIDISQLYFPKVNARSDIIKHIEKF